MKTDNFVVDSTSYHTYIYGSVERDLNSAQCTMSNMNLLHWLEIDFIRDHDLVDTF